jgi:hypothetical protein
MKIVQKTLDTTSEEAIQEFLNNGGVIQKIPYGKKSEESQLTSSGFYGKRKKQPTTKESDEPATE